MKGWPIVAILLLSLVLVTSVSCNAFRGSNKEGVTQQLVEVRRGDLTLVVSGSGNIEISNEVKLTFGVGGRVEKIYVQEGDKVSEGQIIARLETDALKLAVTQAQVARTQAQVTVGQAEVAVTQAQIGVKTAEYNLGKAQDTYKWPEIEVAQADVDNAQSYLQYALESLNRAKTAEEMEMWTAVVARARASLAVAETKLKAMLSGADPEEVAIKKLQVELAKQSLEQARQSLDLTRQSLELAEQSLEQVRKQLDKATLIAPVTGVVTKVSVKEKDTILTTTVMVHLVDPRGLILKVKVDEMDITEVRTGQKVVIKVDALPALQLEGKVDSTGLLPLVEAGVIVYEVKISFDMPDDSGLRAGMSASADIVITERKNVLLVPERAVEPNSPGKSIVKVMIDEQIQERLVTIGISDGLQVEVVDGLKEGEVVVLETKVKSPSPGLFFQ